MIEWRLIMSISGEKQHALLYRGEYKGKGVQMEIYTPVNKRGKFGKAKVYFFADGIRRAFKTATSLTSELDTRLPSAEKCWRQGVEGGINNA